VQVKGLEAPWTTAYLNKTLEYFGGFEGGAGSWGEGSGHYDGLGWGSLLYHLDASDVRALKSSAVASITSSKTVDPGAHHTKTPASLAHFDTTTKPINLIQAFPTTTTSNSPTETTATSLPDALPTMAKGSRRKTHKVKTGCRPPK